MYGLPTVPGMRGFWQGMPVTLLAFEEVQLSIIPGSPQHIQVAHIARQEPGHTNEIAHAFIVPSGEFTLSAGNDFYLISEWSGEYE